MYGYSGRAGELLSRTLRLRPRPPRSAAAIHRRRMPPPYIAVCHYRPLPPSPAATLSPPFSGGISTELWTTSARALSGTARNSRSAFERSAVSADRGVGLLGGGRITDGVGREAGRSDEGCGGRPELLDDRLCEDRGGDFLDLLPEEGCGAYTDAALECWARLSDSRRNGVAERSARGRCGCGCGYGNP